MRTLWLLALVLLAGVTRAESVFEYPVAEHPEHREQLRDLAADMTASARVAGAFTQRKYLEILARPLESKGRFSLDDEGQFEWLIDEPFAQGYRFRDGELIRSLEGEEERVTPADEPSLYGFFQFFSALLQLTEDELESHFQLYFQSGDSDWELGLRPRDRRLRRVLEQLVVRGAGAQIDRVTLTEPGGDRTELVFDYLDRDGPEPDRERP